MSEAKQNAPKLRFPGFTDPWEQRKLGKCVLIQRGGSPRPIDEYITDEPNGINWIKIGDVEMGSRYITHTAEKIKPEGASKSREVYKGDLILSNSMSFGRPYILQVNGCIHDGWLLIRNSQGLFDLEYLQQLLGTESMLSQYRALAAGGVVNNLNSELVQSAQVSFPELDEQRQIGAFFQLLDSLITLHQRKLEHLKLQKRGFLQKMFPKDGADRPEIRFPGFTDPWEQRKLGELASFSKGVGYSKADISETGMPFIHYGRLYTNHEIVVGQVDTFVNPIPGSVFTEGSEVITPSSGETAEDIAIASAVISPGIILGGGLNIVRPGSLLEPIFLALSISYGSQHKELSSKAQGKSVVHLYNDDLKSSSLFYPRIAEQRQIGAFFQQLDSLITLHHRKLEHLQEQKKALLQQMFI